MSVILRNAGDGDTVGHGYDSLGEYVVRVGWLYCDCLERITPYSLNRG